MGLRGPQPKPTHLRVLEGNPGGRKLPEHEPQVPVVQSLPYPRRIEGKPDRMEIWDEVTQDLAVMKGLTKVDRLMIEQYCDVLYRLRAVGKELDEKKATVEIQTEEGLILGIKTSPRFNQYMQLTQLALKFAQNFGMTPSARSRIIQLGSGGEGKGAGKQDPFD